MRMLHFKMVSNQPPVTTLHAHVANKNDLNKLTLPLLPIALCLAGISKWTSPQPGIVEDIYYEHFGSKNYTKDKFLIYYEITDVVTGRPVAESLEGIGGDGGGGGGGGGGGVKINSTNLCEVAEIYEDGVKMGCAMKTPENNKTGTNRSF